MKTLKEFINERYDPNYSHAKRLMNISTKMIKFGSDSQMQQILNRKKQDMINRMHQRQIQRRDVQKRALNKSKIKTITPR